jgi:hypothetical protein
MNRPEAAIAAHVEATQETAVFTREHASADSPKK